MEKEMSDWLDCMKTIREERRKLIFSNRMLFMDELRPVLASSIIDDKNLRIGYPDALFFVTKEDVERAIKAVYSLVEIKERPQ